ncbi:MAG: thioredoxin domain-containing protein, partial [Myxococcales bacterium]|nr:thioredoxin domain-containing protein [Myxococcales bacterium]
PETAEKDPPPPDEKDEKDEKACETYGKKVCKLAGEQSTTCAAMLEATSLMPPAACAAALAEPEVLEQKLAAAKKACELLVSQLCKELGEDTPTCAMVKASTPEFPTERCQAMLAHFDEVLADLRRQEARNKPLEGELLAAIHEDDAPSFGPKDAAVTVVEFSDFQCPFCSRAADTVTALKKKYGDRVRFVFRQFPLSFHKQAHLAAQASLAAEAQGKFWPFHDRLFEDQSALQRPDLEATAKALGLDMQAFKKALDDGAHADQVDADFKLGERVGVEGTPTIFLNGERVENPLDVDAISAAIDAALSASAG